MGHSSEIVAHCGMPQQLSESSLRKILCAFSRTPRSPVPPYPRQSPHAQRMPVEGIRSQKEESTPRLNKKRKSWRSATMEARQVADKSWTWTCLSFCKLGIVKCKWVKLDGSGLLEMLHRLLKVSLGRAPSRLSFICNLGSLSLAGPLPI